MMEKGNIGLLISCVAVLFSIFQFFANRHAATITCLLKDVAELKERSSVLEMQMTVYWRNVGVTAANALHSPHTRELDVLLEKFQRDELANEQELQSLKKMLRDIAQTDPNKWRQKLAQDILTIIHLRYEIGNEVLGSGANRAISP